MRLRVAVAALTMLTVLPVGAQDTEDPLGELVEQERIRAIVESAFNAVDEARLSYGDDTAFVEAYTDIVYDLGSADPGVVPLLVNEAMQADPTTFYLATYALAFQANEEAIKGLYAAIERAENDDSAFALTRKAQLVWALAAAGDSRAVVVADEGRHQSGERGRYRAMSTLEAAAMLTVPESLEILNDELLEEALPLPEDRPRTLYALRAIQRIGDPSSLPVLLHYATSESTLGRIEAVQGLALHADDDAVDALIAALKDEHPTVSGTAARSLAVVRPAGRFEQVLESLSAVSDPRGRGALYEALVGIDPQAAIDVLKRYAPASDATERLLVCKAASMIRSTAISDLLIEQVADPAKQSGVCALKALARFDTDRARRVLVHAIDSPNWALALTASKLATEARLTDAASVIRRRLDKRDFPKLARDATDRKQAEWLVDQLVQLEDVKSIPLLEQALEQQKQASLRAHLEASLTALRAIRDAADDAEKWEALLNHEDVAMRRLAYTHLGRGLRPADDAKQLAAALGRVDPREGLTILRQLSHIDHELSRDTVERVLTAPEYQRPELYGLRDMGAWAARRLGGERMKNALRRAIEMRQARDVRPLIYYAQLSGADAAPLIEASMATRLRFSAVFRGKEYDLLRRLLFDLKQGHSLDYLDLPPNEIVFL